MHITGKINAGTYVTVTGHRSRQKIEMTQMPIITLVNETVHT